MFQPGETFGDLIKQFHQAGWRDVEATENFRKHWCPCEQKQSFLMSSMEVTKVWKNALLNAIGEWMQAEMSNKNMILLSHL